jgi:hypothetical protein
VRFVTPKAGTGAVRGVFPWALGGCLIGIAWFFYNYTLPPLYKGRVCCDSVGYIAVVTDAAGLKDILLGAGERTIAYPLFLGLHRAFLQLLGVAADWVALSLVTSLALHFAAILFVYWVLVARLKARLSPVFLFLALAHPGLVSQAALPLTDSFAASVSAVALGFAMWAYEERLAPRAAFLCHLATGALLGACILTRPSFLLVVATTVPTLWLLVPAIVRARRDSDKAGRARRAIVGAIRHHTLPVMLGVALVSAIGFRNCLARYHSVCVSDPDYSAKHMTISLRWGLGSPRVYTTFGPPKPRNGYIVDPFSFEHFASRCTIRRGAAFGDLARCYAKNAPYAPIHFVKKTIGLFDNPYLNTYAMDVTRPWHMVVNRIFGWLGFLGWMCSLHHLYSICRHKRVDEPFRMVMMGFVLLYVGISINFHIESRHGFPALVPALFMLGTVARSASKRAGYLILAGSAVFWVQTFAWDALPDASVDERFHLGLTQ